MCVWEALTLSAVRPAASQTSSDAACPPQCNSYDAYRLVSVPASSVSGSTHKPSCLR